MARFTRIKSNALLKKSFFFRKKYNFDLFFNTRKKALGEDVSELMSKAHLGKRMFLSLPGPHQGPITVRLLKRHVGRGVGELTSGTN